MNDTTKQLAFLLKRAEAQQEEIRIRFFQSCEWLARNLSEAAARAKSKEYVSETVMSSSLVLDVSQLAREYNVLGETILALREVAEVRAAARIALDSGTGLTINNQPADLTDLAKLASDALRKSPGKWTGTSGRKNRGKDLVCDCGVTRASLITTFGTPEER